MNSQKSVKYVWNRIRVIKGKEASDMVLIYLSMLEMSRLTATLLMHW